MKFRSLRFLNRNGLTLSGRLDLPEDDQYHTVALFAHCFTCTKNVNSAAYISRELVQHGMAVFRFDFTGLGESQGDFSDTNFTTNVGDLISAINFLKQNYRSPTLLIGHSLGGNAVIQAAIQADSVKALVTIGSPADPRHLLTHLKHATPLIQANGEATVDLAGRPFKIKKQFIDNLTHTNLKPILQHLNRAILVMHSPLDDTVGIEHAGILFQTARHPKSFISLDQADHLLSRKEDAQYAAKVIVAWAQRYL